MNKKKCPKLKEAEPVRRRDLAELVTRPMKRQIKEAVLEIIQRIDEEEEMLDILLRQKARELQAEREAKQAAKGVDSHAR